MSVTGATFRVALSAGLERTISEDNRSGEENGVGVISGGEVVSRTHAKNSSPSPPGGGRVGDGGDERLGTVLEESTRGFSKEEGGRLKDEKRGTGRAAPGGLCCEAPLSAEIIRRGPVHPRRHVFILHPSSFLAPMPSLAYWLPVTGAGFVPLLYVVLFGPVCWLTYVCRPLRGPVSWLYAPLIRPALDADAIPRLDGIGPSALLFRYMCLGVPQGKCPDENLQWYDST